MHGNVARAFVHGLHIERPGHAIQLALRAQLRELRLVVGIRDGAGAQAVTQRERHVVRPHDLADLAEMRVGEVLLMVRQAPFGQDGAAATDNAGHPVRGQRDVAQQHARVHREIVDALFRLFDERIAVHFPGQVLRHTAGPLQCLVDGHGADGHGRVAQDPLARFVDVTAGRKVHHRIRAPEDGPAQLLDFLLDGRGNRAVTNVGVDLHLEVAADDHRLQLGMIDVRGNDGAAARDFGAHELRRHALADGNELHLGCDLALPRVVQLRHGLALPGPPHRAASRAFPDPVLAHAGQALANIEVLRAAGVVHAQRRLTARQPDLAHGHAHTARSLDVHLRRAGERALEIRTRQRLVLPSPVSAVRVVRAVRAIRCRSVSGRDRNNGQCRRLTRCSRAGVAHGSLTIEYGEGRAETETPPRGEAANAGRASMLRRRAPYAGVSRIRFQGCVSIPEGIPLAAPRN